MTRREFTATVKLQADERANGRCESCGGLFKGSKGKHYDHENPDYFSKDASLGNCQVLCIACHMVKTGQKDVPAIAKSRRIRKREAGLQKPSRFPGGRGSPFKKKLNGEVEPRS